LLIKNREIALGKAAGYKKLIGSKTQGLSAFCFYLGAATITGAMTLSVPILAYIKTPFRRATDLRWSPGALR
jgi:hypothetical protein